MVSGDPVRKYIDREEIVCEVEQGYVVRQEIRNNFTRRGDTVAYRRLWKHYVRTIGIVIRS